MKSFVDGNNKTHRQLAKKKIIEFSREIGIDAIGFTTADELPELRNYLEMHQEQGYATGWENPDIENRVSPQRLVKQAKSIIVIAMSYHIREDGMAETTQAVETSKNRGRIAKASWGQDYHKVLHRKLEQLEKFILTEIDADAENLASVDTGPLVDRELAAKSGIGFYGYHCNIIHPIWGSFVFLGSLVTTVELEPSQALHGRCMGCRLCMNACPTGAIVEPYRINSNRCLAYLTGTKGEHGIDYQEFLSDQIYGCDICQRVCPHNKEAPACKHSDFDDSEDVKYPDIIVLLTISNKEFQKKFGHTSGIWRGKKPWQRNAMLLIGKRNLKEAIPELERVVQTDTREDMRQLAALILKQLTIDGRA